MSEIEETITASNNKKRPASEISYSPDLVISEGPTIICDTEAIEIVTSTIEGQEPLVLRRKMITIPVEGYNWISPSIAYYKSSSLSNTLSDKDFERKIRKYMWFPTIGLIQENSLIKNALRISKDPKENGFIIKYIYKVFTLIRNKPEVFYPMLNYFLLYQNFAAYNKFMKKANKSLAF